jgi:hypothetical protein
MSTQTTEETLSEDDWQAVRAASAAAIDLLGTSDQSAEVTQEKIQQYLDDFIAGRADNPLGPDLSAALGALWADSICQVYGWEWIVPVHGDWRSLGVADPQRMFLALPFQFFARLIDEEDRQTPGPLIRFKAIAANHLPESAPGRYTIITS